jgi:hypothetical protein
MQYLVFFFLSLFIVVLQTTLLPGISGALWFYDLIIPYAVYFSLYRPFRDGLPVLIVAAMMMDMISGAPAGIYLSTYLWLFLAFRQTWRFLDVKHTYLFPVIVVVGVLFQQFLFWLVISLQAGGVAFSSGGMQVVFFQLLWAVVSAPLIFLFLQKFFAYTDRVFTGKLNENGQSH